MELIFKELANKKDILKSYSLLKKNYKKLTIEEFENAVDEMIERNSYRMVAVFISNQKEKSNKAESEMIAVCGYWISRMLYCGRYLQVSNLYVEESLRSIGIGKKILKYLESVAHANNCQKIVLDSYTENKKSHALYYGEDFYIRGFHFMKDL